MRAIEELGTFRENDGGARTNRTPPKCLFSVPVPQTDGLNRAAGCADAAYRLAMKAS